MKRYIAFAGLAFAFLQGTMAQTIVKPSVKTKTTFAIVTDSKSYEEAKNEIDTYRASVENEGLGTYLLIDDWKTPQPIRELLIKLHADKKAPLEGCVFVGDIPVPMIRDAQHLCSAFKMNQTMAWHRSSVPSDRYYDDFDLQFDYLKQDSIRPDYHYLSLRADGSQYLSPDIYSGRIRPLRAEGMDKYQLLRDYLKKVVAEKQQSNVLDQLSMGRGHGYNSEDLLAWSGEQIAIREQFPQLFKPGNTVKFYDFTFQFPAKNMYLNEVQREDLDMMLFHHHGGTDAQYINGYDEPKNVQENIESIKLFLRSKVPGRAKKVGKEQAIAEYAKQYNVPESWCAEAFDPEKQKADSIYHYHMDIHMEEMHQLRPNARFVLFDACFNGSFHLEDYLAGSYIFNPGKTIATFACSVNSIQDKWPDEFLGLMAAGMRIGQYARLTCFLENHLIGDPTLRFTPNVDAGFDINHALVLKEGDVAFWKKQLNSPLVDMQALALRQLSNADYKDIVSLLKESYFNSNSFMVRLEALRLLVLNYPNESVSVLTAALNDSYELIRRYAGEYAEKNGSPELIPAWVESYLQRSQEKRLRFKILGGIDAFPYADVKAEIEKQTADMTLYNRDHVDALLAQLPRQEKSMDLDIETITNPKSKASYVRRDLRTFRNHPVGGKALAMLLAFVKDESRPVDQRIIATEALGWYNLYHDKTSIIESLKGIQTNDEALKNEIQKSIVRLEGKNR
ncbi:MAG: HEAT repeat domain-containing protein [Bacteroidaceae bacterium]|nr:HEAT repeat domain-containing protein [Bacteroidaceae bacterium]